MHAQSCPTLFDPMGCTLPGSSARGIFQARILGWVAISFSRGSSRPGDWRNVERLQILGWPKSVFRFSITSYKNQHELFVLIQSRPTLCNPMDCSLPGSSVQRVFQARILEWVVIPPLEDLSDPGIKPMSPALTGGFFHHWATCKAPINCMPKTK